MSADRLAELLQRRIAVLDGAMGTMIQAAGLADEAAWRGDYFKNHRESIKGCGDALVLSRPEIIEDIHLAFLRAGTDII